MLFTRENLSDHSPELISAMMEAFTFVWTALYSHVPVNGAGAEEVKIALSRTIVALAAKGITDVQDLRRLALDDMALREVKITSRTCGWS